MEAIERRRYCDTLRPMPTRIRSFRPLPWLVLLLLAGCAENLRDPKDPLQGIVELDQHQLAFEVGGRVLSVSVRRGDALQAGDEIARLDDTLAQLDHERLKAEEKAVLAELDMLLAGSSREDIGALRARVKAAREAVAFEHAELNRLTSLHQSGFATEQNLQAARHRYSQAVGARDELNQRLKETIKGPRVEKIRAAEARAEAIEARVRASAETIRRHLLRADAELEILEDPVKFGQFVHPGTPIVVVADVFHPYVDVFVPQQRLAILVVLLVAASLRFNKKLL